MEHEHQQRNETAYHDNTGQWIEPHQYDPPPHQQQSPAREFGGYSYSSMSMEPMYNAPMQPPRTTHQQLQPLIMPSWPSMLTSQSSYGAPMYASAPVSSTTPIAAQPTTTPVSATSTRSTSSTPRKTLTDADRRKMCLYHEDNPTVKQTEIGAMFGVERSTVSKVLRNKEKYLFQDDGSRSPIKRAKGKFPDIERALSNWVRNHQKQGIHLTDAAIREKARFFATTVGSDSTFKVNSNSWLEKFKQKNNLAGSKSRKNSIAEESEDQSNPASGCQTPNGISPTSPGGVVSPTLVAAKVDDVIKPESPDGYLDYGGHRPFHSQSNNSLSSVFTDAAPSTFSAGATSPNSPFYTPDSACGPSPFVPTQQGKGGQQPNANGTGGGGGSANNFHRPRSQTFPALGIEPFISVGGPSEPLTPKYLGSSAIESPTIEMSNPIDGADDGTPAPDSSGGGGNNRSRRPSTAMQPPPIPPSAAGNPVLSIPYAKSPTPAQQMTPVSPGSSGAAVPAGPSPDDARRALELVMNFFQNQPSGFAEPQDYATIGKLMEKLKLQRQRGGESLPGGMHRIPAQEFARKTEGVQQ